MADGKQDDEIPKTSRWKTGCGVIAVALVALAVIGTITGGDAPPPATPEGQPAVQYQKASARAIFEAYQANQLAAAKTYEGKPLEVSGTIQTIDESMGSPVLQLATANEFMPLRATFDKDVTDALSAMTKGQSVTMRCAEVQEIAGFLSLKECRLL